MSQATFTKEEATRVDQAFTEIFEALSNKQRQEFIGEANDIWLFLAAATAAAPSEDNAPKTD